MSFKFLLILVYSVAGFLIALFTASMTYLIIGEPIGMKMVSKIALVVVSAMPLIALFSVWLGNYFYEKFEQIDRRLENIARGNFDDAEQPQKIEDLERLHRSIGTLSARLSDMIESLRRQNTAISNMTLSLAHDVKTPLTIIDGYVEELKDGMVAEAQLPVVLDKIKSESAYIDDLTSDVLSYLHSMNPVRMGEQVVISELIGEIIPLIPVSPDTRWKIDVPDHFAVTFNRMDLKKLLMNLLHNSAKFTDRGIIAIRIENDAVIIEDTGRGIEPEYFPRLFEPYGTADASRNRQKSGLGLGLVIAKNLAGNNHYDLRFDKSVATGARAILKPLEEERL